MKVLKKYYGLSASILSYINNLKKNDVIKS